MYRESRYPGLQKTRDALNGALWSSWAKLLLKRLVVFAFWASSVAAVACGLHQMIVLRGGGGLGSVIGGSTSMAIYAGVARALARFVEQEESCYLKMAHLLLRFDTDASGDLKRAHALATAGERMAALEKKHFDYMNQLFLMRVEAI